MEPFIKTDIFDTKGMEYIMVIGYLLVLIIFWNIVKNPGRVVKRIQETLGTLSAGILRIPQGIFFSRQHTWTHLGESGDAKVGLDDFVQHVIGKFRISPLKEPGEIIHKGDIMTEISQNGKSLSVYSPISGEIVETNIAAEEDPDIINSDPYRNGWLYRVKPTSWTKETKTYLLAEKAVDWSVKELVRFKDFLAVGPMRRYNQEPSMMLLQDGGEIKDNVLEDLPVEVWEDFQQEFLDAGSDR